MTFGKTDINLSELSVCITDDHGLILEGFRSVLTNNGISNVDIYSNAGDLLNVFSQKHYDIYIIDVEMPGMDGISLTDTIRKTYPDAKIIVSTIHDELWTLRKLAERNVDAIVYKSPDSSQMMTAIQSLLNGQQYYCAEAEAALKLMSKDIEHPSQREMEVLQAIGNGLTSKEIADKLFISENTVEAHRKSLFTKLEARNIAELIVTAVRRGYINVK